MDLPTRHKRWIIALPVGFAAILTVLILCLRPREEEKARVWRINADGLLQTPYQIDPSRPSGFGPPMALRPDYLAAIDRDPTYYQRAEASRIDEACPKPPGVDRFPELTSMSDCFQIATPMSTASQALRVRALPFRPVTFAALDSGTFPNGEHTVTIRADAQGIAETRFSVTREGDYRVIVGSPENFGHTEFSITCMSDRLKDEWESGRYARRYLSEQRAALEERRSAESGVAARIQALESSK